MKAAGIEKAFTVSAESESESESTGPEGSVQRPVTTTELETRVVLLWEMPPRSVFVYCGQFFLTHVLLEVGGK